VSSRKAISVGSKVRQLPRFATAAGSEKSDPAVVLSESDMFYIYVLWSDSLGRYYTGSTQDIPERLRRHNAGHCLATRPGVPWRLIYQEQFPTRSEAVAREKYYKTGRGREELGQRIDPRLPRGK
jgi:putative endonuclease